MALEYFIYKNEEITFKILKLYKNDISNNFIRPFYCSIKTIIILNYLFIVTFMIKSNSIKNIKAIKTL